GETLTGSRREFFLCNLCALRALCGLTFFGRLALPFLVWAKPRLRKSSRRAKKKTVSITNDTKVAQWSAVDELYLSQISTCGAASVADCYLLLLRSCRGCRSAGQRLARRAPQRFEA